MKKLLAVPCGIGLGHSTRVHSVIKELGSDVKVKIATYGSGHSYFSNKGFNPIKMKGIRFSSQGYTFNLFSSLLNNWDFPISVLENMLLFNKIIKQFDPDVVLSDSEPHAVILAKLLKKKCSVITNIPTIPYEIKYLPQSVKRDISNNLYVLRKIIDYLVKEADEIFVPSFIKYTDKLPSNMELTDLFVRKKPSELPPKRVLREKLGLEEDTTLILLSGWGRVQDDFLKNVVKAVKGVEGSFVAVGCGSVKKPTMMGSVKVLPFQDNVLEYLKACDNAITMAGHSYLSEILVYEKPSLVIPIRKHGEQIANASALKRKGLAKVLIPDSLFEVKLKKKIKAFLEAKEDVRRRVKKAGFKGDGASQVAKKIMKKNLE